MSAYCWRRKSRTASSPWREPVLFTITDGRQPPTGWDRGGVDHEVVVGEARIAQPVAELELVKSSRPDFLSAAVAIT